MNTKKKKIENKTRKESEIKEEENRATKSDKVVDFPEIDRSRPTSAYNISIFVVS